MSCTDGDVRLENETTFEMEGAAGIGGRVEVCCSNIYYPVCDEGWTDQNAAVVCTNTGTSSSSYRKYIPFRLSA